MVRFYDPSIDRKKEQVSKSLHTGHGVIPLPSAIEISPSGTCNRVCAFCPRSDPDYPDLKEFVTPALLDKLVSQAAEAGFAGIFIFSGFAEPLIDVNIYDLVALVRRRLPKTHIELVTNGDPLNEARLRRLFDSGLSLILISVYDGPEDFERLQALCRDAGLEEGRYVVRKRYLPPEEDFGITMSNRAGMMENAEHSRPSLSQALQRDCYYPSYEFFMDYNGDVLLCAHDWGKKLIVGNLNDRGFMDLWTSKLMMTVRRRVLNGDRNFDPCRICDVDGTLIGREHADAWLNFMGSPATEEAG